MGSHAVSLGRTFRGLVREVPVIALPSMLHPIKAPSPRNDEWTLMLVRGEPIRAPGLRWRGVP